MIRYILNTYKITKQTILFHQLAKHQTVYAIDLLSEYKSQIPTSSYKRALKYAKFIPVFIGHTYTKLYNVGLDQSELERITLLGALTALFDDLFDNNNYDYSKINTLLQNPVELPQHTEFENTLIAIYNRVRNTSVNNDLIAELAFKIQHAQIESTKQQNSNLSKQELTAITYNKGGYSMQLYRAAFNRPCSPLEMQLFYKIGAIGQLENDIFDIYTDINDGIHTLATETTSIHELSIIYNDLKNEIFTLIDQLNLPKTNLNQFKLIIKLITERGNIALSYYSQSVKNSPENSYPLKLSKSQLTCDMEKPINILKLIHYTAI